MFPNKKPVMSSMFVTEVANWGEFSLGGSFQLQFNFVDSQAAFDQNIYESSMLTESIQLIQAVSTI